MSVSTWLLVVTYQSGRNLELIATSQLANVIVGSRDLAAFTITLNSRS